MYIFVQWESSLLIWKRATYVSLKMPDDIKIRYNSYHLMVLVNYYILDQQIYYVTFCYRKFKTINFFSFF